MSKVEEWNVTTFNMKNLKLTVYKRPPGKVLEVEAKPSTGSTTGDSSSVSHPHASGATTGEGKSVEGKKESREGESREGEIREGEIREEIREKGAEESKDYVKAPPDDDVDPELKLAAKAMKVIHYTHNYSLFLSLSFSLSLSLRDTHTDHLIN